ncbi:sensor domain-containing diguanylate cyclase [Rhodopseudomonas sp. HC1]|uniref:diguanylate cyclase domain-containing protein n=1 Tax=Rhodopseudomonas infernalis TaxID=2897386 RepID=UPI001EE96A47|nr:sensor domain-containing diguanylate cyclase [Rhodopseudomonas infernalis]MCG6207472.1 sensor domain-containing diguanylate cyclase [Rhodopseudomonas infernalis]
MKELFERAANGKLVSHRDLHIILDALPVPLSWALVPGGEIRFMNRAFKKTFGYTEESFRTVDEWIDQTYPVEADRQRARDHWEYLWKAQGNRIREIPPVEVSVRCADGTILTVQHRGILLHDIGIGIATFEDISARKAAEDALHRISFQDPLTGVGNRRALQARWVEETSTSANDNACPVAVLLIDLDDFKPVNDALGHDVGDALLTALADRLRACTRGSDLLFRIGGDEFVILLPGLGHRGQVGTLCRRIIRVLAEPFLVEGQSVAVGATIGASLWPQHGADLREVLRQADEALYRAKRRQKGGWEWFEAPSTKALRTPRRDQSRNEIAVSQNDIFTPSAKRERS